MGILPKPMMTMNHPVKGSIKPAWQASGKKYTVDAAGSEQFMCIGPALQGLRRSLFTHPEIPHGIVKRDILNHFSQKIKI